MNSSQPSPVSPDRPRLVCRLVRPWCALVGESRLTHVASCASCLAYFQAADALDSALRREARRSNGGERDSTDDFERRIIRAVRVSATGRADSRLRRTHRAWLMSGLGAAAAAIAAIVVMFNAGPTRDPRGAPGAPWSTEESVVIIQAVETLSNELVETVLPTAGVLVADNPLQRELEYVYSDFRSALDFLALNFLPASGGKPAPRPERRI